MSSSNLDEFEARAASPGGGSVDLEAGTDVAAPLLGGAAAAAAAYGAAAANGPGPDPDDDIHVRVDAGPDPDAAAAAPAQKKQKEKKEKSGQKLVSDALKTDMAAERTFFKWLWTGLHTGAIGTFIFVTFDSDKSDPYRVAVVAFAWGVAFLLVLYGLFAYNRRRAALRDGRMETLPPITREWGPCIVVVAVLLVVVVGLSYAVLSGASPRKSHTENAFSSIGA